MDKSVISGIIKKDEAAILQFIHLFQDVIYNQCYTLLKNHHDAEEACQDVLIKAINNIHKFEKRSSINTWMYRICFNLCMDKLRSKKSRKKVIHEIQNQNDTDENWSDIDSIIEKLSQEEQRNIIDKALALLNEADALLLNYYYTQDLSLKEIAEIFSISQSSTKVRLFRARKKLAIHLNEMLPEEIKAAYGK